MVSIYAAKHLADVMLLATLHRQRDQQKPETDFRAAATFQGIPLSISLPLSEGSYRTWR